MTQKFIADMPLADICEINNRMPYLADMEDICSDIPGRVLAERKRYNPEVYTQAHVMAAIRKDKLDFSDFGALLSPAADNLLEPVADRARAMTSRYHGNGVSLFTPLYISNYCDNQCIYCGFSIKNKIRRARLTTDEITGELKAIAATGLDEILLLTGESRVMSDVAYIGEAVRLAARFFSVVGIEIYPLNTADYAFLRECGADYVSVYQETYDASLYEQVHPAGPKRCFAYRFNAQERAVRGGMRGVSFGALLGLGDFRGDIYAAGLHAFYLQRKYPRAEIAFSVPRIRAFENHPDGGVHGVGERQLLQVMLALRLFMPFAGITISTRERPGFRDHAAGMCATKMSAGVSVGVGGHESAQKGGGQFEIADGRSVAEIHAMLRRSGLQPVYTNYI